MSEEPFYICECGSNVLALSHTWTDKQNLEEVGYVQEGGHYDFDPAQTLHRKDEDHEWIAYCGGCGKGVTVEWLPEKRVKVLLAQGDQS